MARPSARPKLIQAALTVVEKQGIAALTLDAVAAEAGVTKRGLLYHFPTKHALITGIHEDLASRIEQELINAIGKEPEAATLIERTKGYVQVAIQMPSNIEMQFILEAANEPEWIKPWLLVYHRWFPEGEQPIENLDNTALRCLIARMAADGSWGYTSTQSTPISKADQECLIAGILELIED